MCRWNKIIDCIAKITKNDNVTSLVTFCNFSFSRFSTLFDMQITQVMTSQYIMSVFEMVDFVAYDNKK